MSAERIYCAVDIGGTKILLLLFDERDKILFRKKVPTPKPSEPQAVAGAIMKILEEASQLEGLSEAGKPVGLGISLAGFIDPASGLVYQAPNLFWTKPVPFGAYLAQDLSCPVLIENDANAAVVGEACYGAARGHRDVIYITISTGIGGGLFLDGRLYRGRNGFAGEIGHTKAFGKNRRCNCGGLDCLEAWASGSGLAKSSAELWEQERGAEMTAADLFAAADAGNDIAAGVIEHAALNLGTGLANLITLLNPSCLVIGGGIAANRGDFLRRVTARIKNGAIRPAVEITDLEIVNAALEPEAGAWGMYALLTKKAK